MTESVVGRAIRPDATRSGPRSAAHRTALAACSTLTAVALALEARALPTTADSRAMELEAPAPSEAAARAIELEGPANSEAAHDSAVRQSWPWAAFAAANCYVDTLAETSYLVEWATQAQFRHFQPEWPALGLGEPHPKKGAGPGTARHGSELALLQQWRADAGAHLLDCGLPRPDGALYAQAARSLPYVVLLPSDYLESPKRLRAILYLITGGRGNRTRWFLPEIPAPHEVRGTGGLSVADRVEAWMARHPSSAGPIVVASEDSGALPTMKAAIDFFHAELPKHIRETYLAESGLGGQVVPQGVLAVSSGATAALWTLHAVPETYAAVGLMSLHCGDGGLDPDHQFGGEQGRDEFLDDLAQRAFAGDLALQITTGGKESYLPCVRRLGQQMESHGVWAPGPVDNRCVAESRCRKEGPGFFVYGNYGHSYGAIAASFVDQLDWILDTLDKRLHVPSPEEVAHPKLPTTDGQSG